MLHLVPNLLGAVPPGNVLPERTIEADLPPAESFAATISGSFHSWRSRSIMLLSGESTLRNTSALRMYTSPVPGSRA